MELKDARLLNDFAQEELADKAGMSQQTYSKIERGLRLAKPDERKILSEVLGVPANELEFPDELALKIRTRVG